jgi:hypothetical protein
VLVWPVPFTVSYAARPCPSGILLALTSRRRRIPHSPLASFSARVPVAPRASALWTGATYARLNLILPFSVDVRRFLYLPSIGLAHDGRGPSRAAARVDPGGQGSRSAWAARGGETLLGAVPSLSPS